ncbi:MAG: MFS transporter [Flavobacteriaceae bacterium]|nr:MFS transporter [Flavobacteriaceae bacterium]
MKDKPQIFRAWAFYDWANSVYSLVIASAVFPLFYGALFRAVEREYWPIFGIDIHKTSIIFYTTALAFVVISVAAPLLSGIADVLGNKKFFMRFFCYLGAVSCMGLYFFNLEQIYLSLTLYLLGLIGFWMSIVFYNSYLPDIAERKHHDQLSARGYAMGYIGSVILLLLCLFMIFNPRLLGFESAAQPTRLSFVLTGIWWIGFSSYTFKYLPDFKKPGVQLNLSSFFKGFNELFVTWRRLKNNLLLSKYLTAFFVYSMAVQTVMLVATYFGESEIAWGSDDHRTTGLIVSILLIQIVAVGGAILCSKLSYRWGNLNTLILINFIWILVCVYAYFIEQPVEFYAAAALVGLVMGGIQSLSRSTYSKLLPETKDTTSFFSFFDVTEKIGIVIGMILYASITQLTGDMRSAVLFLVVLFALGIALLFKAKKN